MPCAGFREILDDGHMHAAVPEQVTILTSQRPDLAVAGRGCRGHSVDKTRVPISGTRRRLTPKQIANFRPRHRTRDRSHENRWRL